MLPGVVLYQPDGLMFLAVATGSTLAACRLLTRRPLVALGLMLAASVIACVPLGVGEIPFAQYLAVDVALYVIAATRSRRTALAALFWALALLSGYLTTRMLFGWPIGTSAELAVAMGAVITWLIGRSSHQAREHAEALTARAAAQAVTDERLRISRDLHDTVAHSMGVIALQAGAARRVIDTQPVRAREALAEIEAVGRETLSGLRRMVGTLRQPAPYDSTQAAAGVPNGHAPQPPHDAEATTPHDAEVTPHDAEVTLHHAEATPHDAEATLRTRSPEGIARTLADRLAMTAARDQAAAREPRRDFGGSPAHPLSRLDQPGEAVRTPEPGSTPRTTSGAAASCLGLDSAGSIPMSGTAGSHLDPNSAGPTPMSSATSSHLNPNSAGPVPVSGGAGIACPVPDPPPRSQTRRPGSPYPRLLAAEAEEGGRLRPGLADLGRLTATTTHAGVRVDVRQLGEPRPLPADLDVSAYRVIQEAVTNVVRHAAVDSCQVSIAYHQDALSIEILNDGPAARSLAEGDSHAGATSGAHAGGGADPADEGAHVSSSAWEDENETGRSEGGGYGLTGMRERVCLLNGELHAGPRPEGGFRVAVRLPLPVGA
ncbi:ATP-binding protein [Nonomuraea montanisoli]|uniref:ATP-binding protein n=1 Tax=Nonomuraea montanisoli TaxID=2741721 RepID=UPI001962BBF5|nr:histidine kinase [Nonomuraea montanisoli]